MEVQKYDGYYITSCGRVWSYKSNRFLTVCHDRDGYCYVCMGKQNRAKRIHRLVAETYLPNPNNYDTVDHIDFNKDNNCVNNLQWMSRSENSKKKKKEYKIKCIETGEIFNTINEAAAAYNKTRRGLSDHLNGKQKTFCSYHWEVI